MNKTEAIQRGRALEEHLRNMDSESGDAKTIHALLTCIALLEDKAKILAYWIERDWEYNSGKLSETTLSHKHLLKELARD